VSRADLDLKLAAGLALLAALLSTAVDTSAVRAIPAILLVLVLPGYALSVAVFPQPRETFQRCLLALGLSLCVDVLGALILDRTRVGLTSPSWSIGLAGFTLTACAVAKHRRAAGAPPSVPVAKSRDATAKSRGPKGLASAGLAAAALAMIVAAALIAGLPSSAAHVRGFSTLWILAVKPSKGRFSVGIRSEELRKTSYRLLATETAGQRVVFRRRVTLAPGRQWVMSGTVAVPRTGIPQQVRVSLYKADRPGVVYRKVYMTFETTGP
jgi:Protein of unknown function (DUF1616)